MSTLGIIGPDPPRLLMLPLLIAIAAASGSLQADDTELRDLDISSWPCLNRLEGTAKTPDGKERNRMKNRSMTDLAGAKVEELDTTGFLKKIAVYDAQLNATRRTQLTQEQKQQLEKFENQVVSLTGYLVLSYPGPPETTNCADGNFHDWHLELFEKSSDHHPQIGDPTPIICEITPRTEQAIYRAGIRLQALSGFIRSRKDYTSTNHPPQLVRVTGYLMWDDEHNGKADVGTTVQYVTPANGFHHPWRSTAWEIHPVIKVERLDSVTGSTYPKNPAVTTPATTSPPTTTLVPTATPQQFVTITKPITVKIPYGTTVLQPGVKLIVVSHGAATVRVKYMGQEYILPISSTDLH